MDFNKDAFVQEKAITVCCLCSCTRSSHTSCKKYKLVSMLTWLSHSVAYYEFRYWWSKVISQSSYSEGLPPDHLANVWILRFVWLFYNHYHYSLHCEVRQYLIRSLYKWKCAIDMANVQRTVFLIQVLYLTYSVSFLIETKHLMFPYTLSVILSSPL